MSNINNSIHSRAKNNINNTIIDYRNGKYQGTIEAQTRLPNGMGMFLSQDYHIALGFWKQGRIEGECFIVFPNGSISFGKFSKGQPSDLCCFQLTNGKILYAFTSSSQDCVCLVDSFNKSITVVRMHRDSRRQFFGNMLDKRINYSTDEIKQGKGVFFRNRVQIVEEVRYENQFQKWSKIEEYSKQVIKSEFKEYKSFIRFNFCNLADTQLELTSIKQEVQLRFKKSSIICHIIENNHNQNALRCKLVGYYDQSKQKVEILRKMGQGIDNKVEEICDEEVFNYNGKRPIQARQKLMDYFKKSTHFVNTYIRSKQLEIIGTFFESLYEIIDSQISSKKAQLLLELGHPSKQKYTKESRYTQNIDPASLSQVTNQTLDKINRKNANNYSKAETIDKRKNNNAYDNKSPHKFQPISQYAPKRSNYKYSQVKENYQSPQKQRAAKIETSPTLRQKNYLMFAEDYSPYKKDNKMKGYQSPSKSNNKKYTYITTYNNSVNADQSNYKYPKQKLTLDLNHSRSEYLYRDEQNGYEADIGNRYQQSNKKRESIHKLAKDYEIISQKLTVQRQISNRKDYEASRYTQNKYNIEKSRSPRKYSYLHSPLHSPSSQSNKGKRQWK